MRSDLKMIKMQNWTGQLDCQQIDNNSLLGSKFYHKIWDWNVPKQQKTNDWARDYLFYTESHITLFYTNDKLNYLCPWYWPNKKNSFPLWRHLPFSGVCLVSDQWQAIKHTITVCVQQNIW